MLILELTTKVNNNFLEKNRFLQLYLLHGKDSLDRYKTILHWVPSNACFDTWFNKVRYLATVDHVRLGHFICTFSLLISLSFTLANDYFKNLFTITWKYFDMVCYWIYEPSFASISFEVLRNHVSCHPSSTALGTRLMKANSERCR